MLAQAAACLGVDAPETTAGGFSAQATFMGDNLIMRLEAHAGLHFELEIIGDRTERCAGWTSLTAKPC